DVPRSWPLASDFGPREQFLMRKQVGQIFSRVRICCRAQKILRKQPGGRIYGHRSLQIQITDPQPAFSERDFEEHGAVLLRDLIGRNVSVRGDVPEELTGAAPGVKAMGLADDRIPP